MNSANMKRIVMTVLTLCGLVCGVFAQKQDLSWVSETGARKYPSGKGIFSVNQYGAKADGETLNTKAIQAAIDACAAKGGGVVSFLPGDYVTGAIFLKTGVRLQLDKGVTLLGSQRFEDYPEIATRIAGIETTWPAALLNVIGQKNVAVTGEGIVNARGKFCWDKYWEMRKEYEKKGLRWVVDYDAKRVRTLLVQESSDITLKGITLKNAGFWTVQLLYSDHVTADGLVIRNNEDGHGPSTDGIDIDSSTWVLVQGCDIDCNDDDFCLKAGRDADGLRVNRPTEYVVIRKCMARRGGGMVTLGSETSGGIHHVLATDLVAQGTKNGFLIKSALTRGGTISDIYIRNIVMDSVGTALSFTMNWNPAYSYSTLPAGYRYDSIPAVWKALLQQVTPEQGRPYFKDVYVNNLVSKNTKQGILAAGLAESPLRHFEFSNVHIEAAETGSVKLAEGWKTKNSSIVTKDGAQPIIPGNGL